MGKKRTLDKDIVRDNRVNWALLFGVTGFGAGLVTFATVDPLLNPHLIKPGEIRLVLPEIFRDNPALLSADITTVATALHLDLDADQINRQLGDKTWELFRMVVVRDREKVTVPITVEVFPNWQKFLNAKHLPPTPPHIMDQDTNVRPPDSSDGSNTTEVWRRRRGPIDPAFPSRS